MKKNNKKRILILSLIFGLLLAFFNVRADSGYDVDWGGGGSFGDGDISGIIDLIILLFRNPILFIIVVIIIIILVIYLNNKDKKLRNTTSMGLTLFTNRQIPYEQVSAILGNIDITNFINERFNDFVNIQNGWMNFDHDLLRTKLTDELYNQYAIQLDTMQIKNQQNIMNDFKLFQGMITGISKEENKVTLTMEIITGFYDYLIENGQVTRGKKDRKVVVHYELTFVCFLGNTGICPNCGAKLPETNVCEFCHSVVPNVGTDWVMSKKETLSQK